MASENAPAQIAYTVRKRDGGKDVWTRIGAVFPHQSGNGMNIMLDALPLDRKIVIVDAPVEQPQQ